MRVRAIVQVDVELSDSDVELAEVTFVQVARACELIEDSVENCEANVICQQHGVVVP